MVLHSVDDESDNGQEDEEEDDDESDDVTLKLTCLQLSTHNSQLTTHNFKVIKDSQNATPLPSRARLSQAQQDSMANLTTVIVLSIISILFIVLILFITVPNFLAVITYRLTNLNPLLPALTNLLLRPLRTTQIPHVLDMDLPHLQPQLAPWDNQSLPPLQSSHVHARRNKTSIIIIITTPLSSVLAAEEEPVSADNPYVRRRPMLPLKRGAALDRHRYNQRLKRHFRRSRIRQDLKRKIRYCRSQFDYGRWEGWNEWRRHVKQFDALRRRYEDEGSEDGGDTDDSVSTPEDEAEEDDDEDEDMDDGDTFKLVPATGRLHVVATSSSPGARKESKKPLEWNCWNDCDFPAHCIHARNERKMPEASLNRVFS
ncbi:hypothetical protein TCE0_017f04446 [Talaromyces pinophilus]|uniref:Uncharacterized protein n=1 Tax=Talaromyces pinophilus TaxID=128442 RepID=A0A6V8H3W1_TALPI|nr:hypothetical protein TCE0_017f04446 [Talaromyces pinophilus]